MEEKRKNPRFTINQMIAYGPNREEYVYAEIGDLSREGLSCVSNQQVDIMTNVYLMMRVPYRDGSVGGSRQVRCEGYVSHSKLVQGRCSFGIRITSVYEADVGAFEAYLVQLEREAAEAAAESAVEAAAEAAEAAVAPPPDEGSLDEGTAI